MGLVKLISPVVNFISILQAAFAPIFFAKKNTNLNCNKRKIVKNIYVQKKLLLKYW